jgi:hypothetical protein
MEKFYPASLIDPMLKMASEGMHELTDVCEQQQGEITQLQKELTIAKAAASNKVTLEKVANAGVSETQASQFASFLETRGIIPAGSQEKYASACRENAGTALEIAMQAIKLSEPPAPQGYGTKSAGLNTADAEAAEEAELWARCMTSSY